MPQARSPTDFPAEGCEGQALSHIRRVYEAHHKILSAIVRGEYRGGMDAPLRTRP